MAIKAGNQITLIDLTDGYSVILTNENHTFLGTTDSVSGTQTTTCTIQALCGGEVVSCSVGSITAPTGLSIVSDKKTPTPTLTITATSALKTSGTVVIPIIIGEITVNKNFSYSIAFTGATGANGKDGANGTNGTNGKDGEDGKDGADAISMVIISSNGNVFKNSSIATTLTAHVYKGGVEVTGSNLTAIGTIKWYKDGGTTAVATGSTLTINAGDVANHANYTAQLEG